MARKIEAASEPHKGASSRSSSEWAQQIGTAWRNVVAKTIEGFLETGGMLIEAKRTLRPGQFLPMIQNDLPFGEDTAEKLMAIAKNSVLSDSAHRRNLPPRWTVLYELNRIPKPALRRLLRDGLITPATERREAERMREEAAPKTRYATEMVVTRVPDIDPVYVRTTPQQPEPKDIDDQSSRPLINSRSYVQRIEIPYYVGAPSEKPTTADVVGLPLREIPVDHFARLMAEWKAATEDERRRFLQAISATIEVAR